MSSTASSARRRAIGCDGAAVPSPAIGLLGDVMLGRGVGEVLRSARPDAAEQRSWGIAYAPLRAHGQLGDASDLKAEHAPLVAAWRLGLKTIAIYRQGSKITQPMGPP